MSSQYQQLKARLDEELSKQVSDSDIVYALKLKIPYANTIDTDKAMRGHSKLNNQSKGGKHE